LFISFFVFSAVRTDLVASIQSWLKGQVLKSAVDQNSEEQASNFQIFSDGFQQALQDTSANRGLLRIDFLSTISTI
jgi:hypothetical protein